MEILSIAKPTATTAEGVGDSASDMALYDALQAKVQECEMLRRLLQANTDDVSSLDSREGELELEE